MQVSIRGIDRDAYSIFASNGGQHVPIEKDLEKALAFKEAFEGAIYLHMGTPDHVSKLDHDKKEIRVEETKAEYYRVRKQLRRDALKQKEPPTKREKQR